MSPVIRLPNVEAEKKVSSVQLTIGRWARLDAIADESSQTPAAKKIGKVFSRNEIIDQLLDLAIHIYDAEAAGECTGSCDQHCPAERVRRGDRRKPGGSRK